MDDRSLGFPTPGVKHWNSLFPSFRVGNSGSNNINPNMTELSLTGVQWDAIKQELDSLVVVPLKPKIAHKSLEKKDELTLSGIIHALIQSQQALVSTIQQEIQQAVQTAITTKEQPLIQSTIDQGLQKMQDLLRQRLEKVTAELQSLLQETVKQEVRLRMSEEETKKQDYVTRKDMHHFVKASIRAALLEYEHTHPVPSLTADCTLPSRSLFGILHSKEEEETSEVQELIGQTSALAMQLTADSGASSSSA
jgi:hypothetical protein